MIYREAYTGRQKDKAYNPMLRNSGLFEFENENVE